jgi:ATP-dependent helicase/nuclease subunit A
MSELYARPLAPDQLERDRALDVAQSILVQAPAGSGKTDLLTRRFLALLSEVEDPAQVVAITFTRAAAAEMRHRILSELESASSSRPSPSTADPFSMKSLARRALVHSHALGWQLIDLPAQLRISTIDSFCRELALQQPLLAGFGNDLRVSENPQELYLRAARRTLRNIDDNRAPLSTAIEELLLWRDNNWNELEDLLVETLSQRDRWMHDFVLEREPDWAALRERLERPFAKAVRESLNAFHDLLERIPGVREEAVSLARFACTQSGGALYRDLAELVDFPAPPFASTEALEEARHAILCLAKLVLTNEGAFRKKVYKSNGFPSDCIPEKIRFRTLVADLRKVGGLETSLAKIRNLPPVRYTDEDWRIVRACFTLLRHAAAELRTVFAEAGTVDFIEITQIAQHVLRGGDRLPSDAAIAVADGIHHLLVDEFQDTSRRQHHLLANVAAAWPDPIGRSLFVVGDPMQSIYFFRDADAELFARVRTYGLEMPDGGSLSFEFVPLTANFRTQPSLIRDLNNVFLKVFAANDGSGVSFSPSDPSRDPDADSSSPLSLHLEFSLQSERGSLLNSNALLQAHDHDAPLEGTRAQQIAAIVSLVRSRMEHVAKARSRGEKYRIAILGRTRSALAPIAAAMREESIPFRSVDLETLKDRPEVLDALALGRALLNPVDRVAWLGVLRAPWCGLPLDELHRLTSSDDKELLERPIPQLMRERIYLLRPENQRAVRRILDVIESVTGNSAVFPTRSFGTWLQQAWLRLGGTHCVDATGYANLMLLWRCLDSMPNGAQDFLGPTLSLALKTLTAMPDPGANSECGVQLMTIHKAKGLEFEVVVIPELQARNGRSRNRLLSWLERGLAQPEETGEVTEFLVAPVQSKGADRGKAKEFVDRLCAQRETQEMRRILYVAATRAREELHLFARPEYKDDAGNLSLVEPKNSLLATAWPAFETEIRARFEEWKACRAISPPAELLDIAASADNNLIVLPSRPKATLLRRLPANFTLEPSSETETIPNQLPLFGIAADAVFTRHEGGPFSRVLGTAVHRLLEEMARLYPLHDWEDAATTLTPLLPRVKAHIRSAGISPTDANAIASRALEIAIQASRDPTARWILSPHTGAASETAWTGLVANALRSVRVDRVFRAGLAPLSEGEEAWWVVDYKTAHADGLDPAAALPRLRSVFEPQLQTYAAILRSVIGQGLSIRAGLYYPRMVKFDWWATEV